MFKLVVLSVVLAVAAAEPSGLGLAPWGGHGWGAHLGVVAAAPLAAPLAAPVVAAPLAHAGPAVAVAAPLYGAAHNYRGPWSLAPGQPANIVAHDGRPLDTLSVNVDRALHYTARAVDAHNAHGIHGHLLGKRSAPLLAPAAWSHVARIDVPALGLSHAALGIPAVAPWHEPAAHLGWGLGHAGHLAHHW